MISILNVRITKFSTYSSCPVTIDEPNESDSIYTWSSQISAFCASTSRELRY